MNEKESPISEQEFNARENELARLEEINTINPPSTGDPETDEFLRNPKIVGNAERLRQDLMHRQRRKIARYKSQNN